MSPPYTPRQGQFLAYIQMYTEIHKRPPSESDMQAYFQVSPPSVHQMIIGLENRGLISRTPGQPRSIRVLVPPKQLPSPDSRSIPGTVVPTFTAIFPHIARWVVEGGCVQLGQLSNTGSKVSAIKETGVAWEATRDYSDMDDLLRDLDKGIAQWVREHE
jgi:hypothetical protein